MKKLLMLDLDGTGLDTHETGQLYPDVKETLGPLGRKCRMILLTKGDENEQYGKLERCDVVDFFEDIIIVPQNSDKFEKLKVMAEESVNKGVTVIVVGDRIDVEIRYGNQLKLTTVRVKRPNGKYATMVPQSHEEQPTYEVVSFFELLELLQKI